MVPLSKDQGSLEKGLILGLWHENRICKMNLVYLVALESKEMLNRHTEPHMMGVSMVQRH